MKLGILTGDADADALWLGRGSSCGSRLGLLAKRPVNGPSFANRIDHNKKKLTAVGFIQMILLKIMFQMISFITF